MFLVIIVINGNLYLETQQDCMNFQSRESDRHSAHHHNMINNNTSGSRRTKSKSTEDMNMGE